MFEKAMDEMAYNFSSNEFSATLRTMGCPERLIKQHQTTFLRERCVQDGTKRMWIKEKPEVTPYKKKPRVIEKTSETQVGIIRKFLRWIY